MSEISRFSAFIRRKLVAFGLLSDDSMVESESISPYDTPPGFWWTDLQHHFHQFVNSFAHLIDRLAWGKWIRNDGSAFSASELLPGFMETGEARARVEFDTQRQVWTAYLDYTRHSLACHLEMVNEESIPIMKQIISAHQPESPPSE